jgi:hypothetical protein
MASDSRAEEDFKRRRELERARHDKRVVVKHASDAVLQSLVAAGERIEKQVHPVVVKRKLATVICSRVRCPGFQRAEAEKAAGYVLEPWPGEQPLPVEVIYKLLDQLDEADSKGKVSPYVEGVGGGRGKWFVGVLKLRLKERGITQRKKGVRRS